MLEKLLLATLPSALLGLTALCVYVGSHKATVKSLSTTVRALADVVSSLSEQVAALQATVDLLHSSRGLRLK